MSSCDSSGLPNRAGLEKLHRQAQHIATVGTGVNAAGQTVDTVTNPDTGNVDKTIPFVIESMENEFDAAQDSWNATFDAQFSYKYIKSFVDANAAGEKITDATRLNAYSIGTAPNLEWYGLIQSTVIPAGGLDIPAVPDDTWTVVDAVKLNQMRTDSASQLGYVYFADWGAGLVIPNDAMRDKLAIWHNGQFYSVGTDTGFTSNDFTDDLAAGRFVSRLITTDFVSFANINQFKRSTDNIDVDAVELLNRAMSQLPDYSTLVFNAETYVLNSYAGTGLSAVVNLNPTVTIFAYGATFKLGNFFEGKEFILFNGLGSDGGVAPLNEFNWFGGTFDFNSSLMTTSYVRRIGIHGGQCGNSRIRDVIMKNGDLTNPIIMGEGAPAKRSFVSIECCYFYDLAISDTNTDHTSIYLKAENSHVVDCHFISTQQRMALIGCPVELHGSMSSYRGGSVQGYHKGVILTALALEGSTTGLIVSDVTANITTAFAWIWSEVGVELTDCLVSDCNVKCNHVTGLSDADSLIYNTQQGLFTSGGLRVDENTATGITFNGNVTKIVGNLQSGTKTAWYLHLCHNEIIVENNDFYGCSDGVKGRIVASSRRDMSYHRYINNRFYKCGSVTSNFFDFDCVLNEFTVKGNIIEAQSFAAGSLLFTCTESVSNSEISFKLKRLLAATPDQACVVITIGNGNKVADILFSSSLSYPNVDDNNFELVTITHPYIQGRLSVTTFDYTINNAPFHTKAVVIQEGKSQNGECNSMIFNKSGSVINGVSVLSNLEINY